MRDTDTILLEDIYTNQILLNEAAPRQRNYIQGAWDRLAGEPLDHSTSIARNQLIDMYRKVWKSFEDDWESNNAITRNPPIPVTLDYLADFINRKYSQIDLSKIVDPLALEYSPNGDFTEELEQQTIGDFLYDTLVDYYESVGGMDQGTGNLEIPNPQQPTQQPNPQPTQQPNPQPTQQPNPQPTQQPNPQPTQQPNPQPTQQPNPQPTQQPNQRKYKLPRTTFKSNSRREREKDKKTGLWSKVKDAYKKGAAGAKSQIINT